MLVSIANPYCSEAHECTFHIVGKLLKWQLILYGVAEEPVRLKQITHPKPLKPLHIENNIPKDDVSESR